MLESIDLATNYSSPHTDVGMNSQKHFKMIDNYMYLYHVDTLLSLPFYPEQVQDSQSISYNPTQVLSRTAPIQSYMGSGPRTVSFSFKVHRDMFKNIDYMSSSLPLLNTPGSAAVGHLTDDYADTFIKYMQASVLPDYKAAQKMVNPPLVAVKFGNDIFIKGVITSALNLTYSVPILRTDKYATVDFSLTITEIDPYDARSVMSIGSYRDDAAGIFSPKNSLYDYTYDASRKATAGAKQPTNIIRHEYIYQTNNGRSGHVGTAGENAKQLGKNIISSVGNTIKSGIASGLQWVGQKATDTALWIGNAVQTAGKLTLNPLTYYMGKGMNAAVENIWDYVGGVNRSSGYGGGGTYGHGGFGGKY